LASGQTRRKCSAGMPVLMTSPVRGVVCRGHHRRHRSTSCRPDAKRDAGADGLTTNSTRDTDAFQPGETRVPGLDPVRPDHCIYSAAPRTGWLSSPIQPDHEPGRGRTLYIRGESFHSPRVARRGPTLRPSPTSPASHRLDRSDTLHALECRLQRRVGAVAAGQAHLDFAAIAQR
jgi:hypothetical protein